MSINRGSGLEEQTYILQTAAEHEDLAERQAGQIYILQTRSAAEHQGSLRLAKRTYNLQAESAAEN